LRKNKHLVFQHAVFIGKRFLPNIQHCCIATFLYIYVFELLFLCKILRKIS